MHGWPAERIAEFAGAALERPGAGGSPTRVIIDSRIAGPGDLFVGLVGANADGGAFAAQALDRGAWGVLIGNGHAADGAGAVLTAADPLAALQRLATAWRRGLGASVVGITGSTGKTSTKDVLAAMLRSNGVSVVATPENLNTEIGLPLTILSAPPGTRVLVLEMAMRGPGQIAELTAIAEPQIGVITNVGPVHLELLESIEAIAAAKAELIAGLPAGGTAIIPADEPLLEPHLREDIEILRFGVGALPAGIELRVAGSGTPSAHMLRNAQAALEAAHALGVEVTGAIDVSLSSMRGQRVLLDEEIVVVNDCYNANPMSMRAALDDLSASALRRRVAVLGDMLELGPQEIDFHRQIGEHARANVDLLITVGPLARHMGGDHAVSSAADAAKLLPGLLQPGDTVLVKASRGVGLEALVQELAGNG